MALPLRLTELNKGIPYLEKKTREGEILFISTAHEKKMVFLLTLEFFKIIMMEIHQHVITPYVPQLSSPHYFEYII